MSLWCLIFFYSAPIFLVSITAFFLLLSPILMLLLHLTIHKTELHHFKNLSIFLLFYAHLSGLWRYCMYSLRLLLLFLHTFSPFVKSFYGQAKPIVVKQIQVVYLFIYLSFIHLFFIVLLQDFVSKPFCFFFAFALHFPRWCILEREKDRFSQNTYYTFQIEFRTFPC